MIRLLNHIGHILLVQLAAVRDRKPDFRLFVLGLVALSPVGVTSLHVIHHGLNEDQGVQLQGSILGTWNT